MSGLVIANSLPTNTSLESSRVNSPISKVAPTKPIKGESKNTEDSFSNALNKEQQGKANTSENKSNYTNENKEKKTETAESSNKNLKKEESKDLSKLSVYNQETNIESKEPMLKFLDSMERELGVEPDRILAAFSNLSNESLNASAIDSADDFVGELDLTFSESSKARKLYDQMLVEINHRDNGKTTASNESTKISPEKSTQENMGFYPKKDLSSRDIKLQQIAERSARLETMNQRFFDVYPADNFKGIQQVSPMVDSQIRASGSLSIEKLDAMRVPADNSAWLNNSASDATIGLATLPKNSEQGSEFSQQNPERDFKGLYSVDNNISTEELDSDYTSKIQSFQKLGEQDLAVNGKGIQSDTNVKELKLPVDEIIQRADLLVKKGGGEMKIQMSSEEIGQIHMKISVTEGKVDIQLLTENAAVKKALEADISNLKIAIAENKLELREIKVDVSQNLGKGLEDQQANQQREQARQFLDFFRQNHGSGRNAFNFANASSSYQRSQSPEEVMQSESGRNKRQDGRLSVVA